MLKIIITYLLVSSLSSCQFFSEIGTKDGEITFSPNQLNIDIQESRSHSIILTLNNNDINRIDSINITGDYAFNGGVFMLTIDNDTIGSSKPGPITLKKNDTHTLTDFYFDPCPICAYKWKRISLKYTVFFNTLDIGEFTINWTNSAFFK